MSILLRVGRNLIQYRTALADRGGRVVPNALLIIRATKPRQFAIGFGESRRRRRQTKNQGITLDALAGSVSRSTFVAHALRFRKKLHDQIVGMVDHFA